MVLMFWCRVCHAWKVPDDTRTCPECGTDYKSKAPTSFQPEAAVMEVYPRHSETWHKARRRLGGYPTCDCGVRV